MKKEHFLTLDGLRGLAAFGVLLFHRRWLVPGGHFLDHAYLAVDFFFGLSGFVIAYAYGARLRDRSISFLGFLAVRVIRLYPLLILAGALAATASALDGHTGVSVLIADICAMLALPTLIPVDIGGSFT
ncbi:hypothetical protein UB31_11670 [Bradyrhizobium sp. LTSP849]|uniref:acyltransferase family protein n=1 Tax=Bradyrhizobium sp. LTSP849 TaxID=1615890 RepID=UPI0005D1DA2B|nr:acyltransferase family protein [Bradyrhizobium sp. LTSP849]KJC50888.1 hypothetical protein UB31_11670 [Bradyrhizobium sp. LTSP849]